MGDYVWCKDDGSCEVPLEYGRLYQVSSVLTRGYVYLKEFPEVKLLRYRFEKHDNTCCRGTEGCIKEQPKHDTCSTGGFTVSNDTQSIDVGVAVKYDSGKPDLSHISYELVELVAKVRDFGAKKYARNNWKKGFKQTRSLAAALRHIFLYLKGETNDSESGLSHLGHAVCCLEHAIYDSIHHPENDDRLG